MKLFVSALLLPLFFAGHAETITISEKYKDFQMATILQLFVRLLFSINCRLLKSENQKRASCFSQMLPYN